MRKAAKTGERSEPFSFLIDTAHGSGGEKEGQMLLYLWQEVNVCSQLQIVFHISSPKTAAEEL
jgi:hypothetical protein